MIPKSNNVQNRVGTLCPIRSSYAGVYLIICLPTGDSYVGASRTLRDRLTQHRSLLRRGRGSSKKMQYLWDTHGDGSFDFKAIIVCPEDLIDHYEQIAIDALKPTINAVPMAGKPKGFQHFGMMKYLVHGEMLSLRDISNKYKIHRDTVLFRVKAGYSGNDLALPPDHGRSARGQQKSEEHRRKIGDALRGKRHSCASKEKMSLALRGEGSPSSKLNEQDVMEIRQMAQSGSASASELAERFSVGEKAVRDACIGRTWRHLSGAGYSNYKRKSNNGAGP